MLNKPSFHLNVFKSEVSARVSLVASNDTWCQDSTLGDNVSESDISYGDSRFGFAILEDGVKHAAWTTTIGLLLLLGSDINSPPDGVLDGQVLIQDILDDTRSSFTWVSLNIDSLEGVSEDNVSEGNISNASNVIMRRYSTDGHTNSVDHGAVFNSDVFSALCDLIFTIAGLNSNGIIEASDCHISDDDVGSCGINTISIKRESWNSKGEIVISVLNSKLLLLEDINFNDKVFKDEVIDISGGDVILR